MPPFKITSPFEISTLVSVILVWCDSSKEPCSLTEQRDKIASNYITSHLAVKCGRQPIKEESNTGKSSLLDYHSLSTDS